MPTISRTCWSSWAAVASACAALLAGCYQEPLFPDCVKLCRDGADCAPGQRCGDDGLCAAPEIAGRCAAITDADGADVDAADLCRLGCTNGECDDAGVCVITCGPGECTSDVSCVPNLPCRIVCEDEACQNKVKCASATRCEIVCRGTGSCEQVECGSVPCSVRCEGAGSCKNENRCEHSCSCDVFCLGAGSCSNGSQCPDDARCSLGAGCTSALDGCATC
jgi:hypothetical protein